MRQSVGFSSEIVGIDLTLQSIKSPVNFDENYVRRLFEESLLKNSHFFI